MDQFYAVGGERANGLDTTWFRHGFLTLSEFAEFLYKTTDYWYPEHERTLLWNDPTLEIAWPLIARPVLAPKDQADSPFSGAETYT